MSHKDEPNGGHWLLCKDYGPEGLGPPFFVFSTSYSAEKAQSAIKKFPGADLTKIVRSDQWPTGLDR